MINFILGLSVMWACTLEAFHHNIFGVQATKSILPKLWCKYTEKHTFNSLKHLSNIGSITEWLEKHKRHAYIFKHTSRSKLNFQYARSAIKRATGLVKLDTNTGMNYLFGYQNEAGQTYVLDFACNNVCFGYSWWFKVSNRLTANITFEEIYFSSGPYLCEEGHLDLMYAKPRHYNKFIPTAQDIEPCTSTRWQLHKKRYMISDFYFCGHHSSFTLFPESDHCSLSLTVYYGTYFVIDAIFSLLDNNIVYTKQVKWHNNFNSRMPQLLYVVHIHTHITQLIIWRFYIVKEKNFVLKIKLSSYLESSCKIFDGPGHLSPTLTVANGTVSTTTFQCLGEVLFPLKHNHIPMLRRSFVSFEANQYLKNIYGS